MVKDGHVYAAGHSKTGKSHPVSFARVRVDRIGDLHSYEFLDSEGGWSRDFARCAGFLGDVAGECSLSFNEYYGVFDLFYARMFTGETVHVEFKDFSLISRMKSRVVYRPAPPEDGEMWPYSGKEIFSWDKTNYLIYIDPEIYQPILLEYKRR